MSLVLALALVVSGSVQYEPASPTVGDLITISFPDVGEGKLSLLPADEYEVVSVAGEKAVVRTFRPGSIKVVGEILTPGEQTQRHTVEIEIRSVLSENDDLQPAPLVLPKRLPPNRVAWWMLGGAAVAALAMWSLLYFVAGRMSGGGVEEGSGGRGAAAIYLERLHRIDRLASEDERWRQLADATRWILPRIDRALGPELTTSEILATLRGRRYHAETIALVDRILHGGDWAKFSPFGAPDDASKAALSQARGLTSLLAKEEAA